MAKGLIVSGTRTAETYEISFRNEDDCGALRFERITAVSKTTAVRSVGERFFGDG